MTSGMMPASLQDAHDADMRPAPRCAAAKGKADFQLAARVALDRCLHGGSVSASPTADPGAAPGDTVCQTWSNTHDQAKNAIRP